MVPDQRYIRLQRQISKLQNKLKNSEASRTYWTNRAVFLAKKLKPGAPTSEVMELAGYKK